MEVLILRFIDVEQISDRSNKQSGSDEDDGEEHEKDKQSESDGEPIDHKNRKPKRSNSESSDNIAEAESNSSNHSNEEQKFDNSPKIISKSKKGNKSNLLAQSTMNPKNPNFKIMDDYKNSMAKAKLSHKDDSISDIDESEGEVSSGEEPEGTFVGGPRKKKQQQKDTFVDDQRKNKGKPILEDKKKQNKRAVSESENESEDDSQDDDQNDDQDNHPREYITTDLETDFEIGTFIEEGRAESVSF